MRVRSWDGNRTFAFEVQIEVDRDVTEFWFVMLSPRASKSILAINNGDRHHSFLPFITHKYIFSENGRDLSYEEVSLKLSVIIHYELERRSQLELF